MTGGKVPNIENLPSPLPSRHSGVPVDCERSLLSPRDYSRSSVPEDVNKLLLSPFRAITNLVLYLGENEIVSL